MISNIYLLPSVSEADSLLSNVYIYIYMVQLEAEGYTLKAIQNFWNSTDTTATSAAENSHFHHVHHSQTNPMECQPEPVLQIGYATN